MKVLSALLLLLPLIASAETKEQHEARVQKSIDKENYALVQLMLTAEKKLGGVNSSGKCYDTLYNFRESWKEVPWCMGNFCMPIYSRYTLDEQRWQMGFAYNQMMSCQFTTNTGYRCGADISHDDNGKFTPYVMCRDSRDRRFELKNGKLVPFKPAPIDPTPIPECARKRLNWMQEEMRCKRLEDENEKRNCLTNLGPDPGSC